MNAMARENGSIFILILSIELIAEIILVEPDYVPGTGFSVL
jgi:hypothetical protein